MSRGCRLSRTVRTGSFELPNGGLGRNVHNHVHNHVHLERHLGDRATDKTRRSAARAEWQSLMA